MDKDTERVPPDDERDQTEHPHDDPKARKSTEGNESEDADAVEEASRDSFPSSDPPAW